MHIEEDSVVVVLSADDDPNSQLLLKHAFDKIRTNALLKQVNDGSEAIAYLSGTGQYADRKQFPFPKLLLLDLKMPRVTGFGVLEYLRDFFPPNQLPAIVLSTSDDEYDISRAYALGCDAYVLKPSDIGKLIQFLAAVDREFLGTKTADPAAPSFESFIISPAQESLLRLHQLPAMPEEQQVTSSPEMFRLLVEQVKDYAILMLNLQGFILSWNEGVRRIMGYEKSEILGKHFSIFYPPHDREDKPKIEIQVARETGRFEEEAWRIRKDGSRFWANVVVTPVRDRRGNLTGFAKITRDLTARKLHEDNLQRLLESEERFRLLVDQVKDYAIFMLDARGHISSWNQGAKRLKGYSSEEIIGRHFSIFYTQEDVARDHPAAELNIAIKEGRYEEEGWRVRKDGSRFWANVVITSLWDSRGNLSGFAKVTRDLTQRKQQEDALRRKNEDLESMAHTLSHDLRAPLRSIASFAQVLKEEGRSLSHSELLYLDKILQAAGSMQQLIDGILVFSQVSLAPVSEQSSFPLEEVLTEVLSLHELELQKTRASVRIQKPLPIIHGTRTLALQIFSNLISNAVKFVPRGRTPQVEISAVQRNGCCEIRVKDNGQGIPEKVQKRIFNLFDRGAADMNISGTGIGLAIVKKAAERMGGNISLLSTEGAGSEFIVCLPCEDPLPIEQPQPTH